MYGRGQQPGMRIGPPITPPIVKQLMIANAVVFLIQQVSPETTIYGSLVPKAVCSSGISGSRLPTCGSTRASATSR